MNDHDDSDQVGDWNNGPLHLHNDLCNSKMMVETDLFILFEIFRYLKILLHIITEQEKQTFFQTAFLQVQG